MLDVKSAAATLVAVMSVLLVAACGEDAQARRADEAEENVTGLASCLRESGVEVGDPVVGDGYVELPEPVQGWDAEAEDARAHCVDVLGWDERDLTEEELAQALQQAEAYAACLQGYGIEIADPAIIDGEISFGEAEDPFVGLDVLDDESLADLEVCQP